MMDEKSASQSASTNRIALQNVEAGRLAIRASMAAANGDLMLNAILGMKKSGISTASVANNALTGGEWTLKEVACAREFNFELSADRVASLARMEQAVKTLLGVRKTALLVFDEETGLYCCLSDLGQGDSTGPEAPMRELPLLSDAVLQSLLGTEQAVLQGHLATSEGLIGLVVAAEKLDGAAFTTKDQMLLDLMGPYLAVKMASFMQMRKAQSVPYIQGVVLELAGRLVMAVDQDSIISILLETFVKRLGFEVCQYVGFNAETGIGEVLYDIRKPAGSPETARVQSYSHAGQEGKRRTIREFSNLVGLLSSMARNRFYLHLNGKKLGDRSLGEIFGVRSIQSALLLPVVDIASGEIRGTLNLFRLSDGAIREEAIAIARESVQLASQALNRALVLEKALAMASSDELTGLINRRGYYQRFESELERARRHQTPLCVALVDVDHFKKFNDTYGHLSGDLILKALAELFTQNMRKSDVVCRFGGEEFAILLPDTGLKSAVELMDRVRQNVEKLQLRGLNGEALRVTISVGLTEVNTRPKVSPYKSEISEALAIADEQLYVAKNQGRNQVCTVQPDAKQAKSRQQAG